MKSVRRAQARGFIRRIGNLVRQTLEKVERYKAIH
jgi:hypothetical protein